MPLIDKEKLSELWPLKGPSAELKKISNLPTLTLALSLVGVKTISDLLSLRSEEVITLSGIGVKRYKKVIAMQVELRAFVVTQKRLQFRRKAKV